MSNTNEETVTISKALYESLKVDSRKLLELEWAGVDNWDGYYCIDWTYIQTGKREDD